MSELAHAIVRHMKAECWSYEQEAHSSLSEDLIMSIEWLHAWQLTWLEYRLVSVCVNAG